jgi:hypothetical protein
MSLTQMRSDMGQENKWPRGSPPSSLPGVLWFGGWLFTIGFAKLVSWKILFGLVVWPYFLGIAVR